jgi:cytidine deaminase
LNKLLGEYQSLYYFGAPFTKAGPMTPKELTISYRYFANESELPVEFQNLLKNAENALDLAYAPYSHFQVGAALLMESGEIITGANQENAAYPSGLCAERTAIYYAGAHHPKEKIKAVFVVARKEDQTELIAACPCGACRQAMLEYEDRQNSPIPVIFRMGKSGFVAINSVADLLPFKFDSDSLN